MTAGLLGGAGGGYRGPMAVEPPLWPGGVDGPRPADGAGVAGPASSGSPVGATATAASEGAGAWSGWAIDRSIAVALERLDGPPGLATRAEVVVVLESIDEHLRRLVENPDVDTTTASRLGRARAELGGYLEAAAALEAVNMPEATIADVLRRAVRGVRSTVGPTPAAADERPTTA